MGAGASSSAQKGKASAKAPPKRNPEDVDMVGSTPLTEDAMSAAPTRVASCMPSRVTSVADSLDQLGAQVEAHLVEKEKELVTLPSYGSEDVGEPKTLEYRRFLGSPYGGRMSFWHDVPLHAGGGAYHAVVEITRMTTAKMEISTTELGTPIKQDTKKGKLRDYAIPIKWNYGALAQTWEQPDHVWEGLEGHAGDNDPVDIVDLSTAPVECGIVIQFKPLAALAMIDEGEVDWKVVGINMADPLAASINSLDELEAALPGEVDAVREWFTWYKAVDGNGQRMPDKEPNVFGFDGKPIDTQATRRVIAEGHACWHSLITRQTPAGELKLA